MADIFTNNETFKERKNIEQVFLEFKPFSLEDDLNSIAPKEKQEEKNEFDDELITIDLQTKNNKVSTIEEEISDSIDYS